MAERKKQRRRRKVGLHRDAEGLEKAIITGSGGVGQLLVRNKQRNRVK
jgi:hypothetical protein